MNKIAKRALIAALALVICLAPVSCASEPAPSEPVGTVAEEGAVTLSQAYERFSGFYAEGHAEFINAVSAEIDRLKEKISAADAEVKKLIGDRYVLHAEMGLSDSPEDFRRDCLAPYERYAAARLEALELSGDAFYALSAAVSAGGSAAGDSGLLMEYVHCANLYKELEDLKDLLS